VQAFTEAYTNLLGKIQSWEYTLDLDALNISMTNLQSLEGLFSEEEVWAAIKELPQDRARGPGGFITVFYQVAWTIKGGIMAGLQKLAVGDGRGFSKLNSPDHTHTQEARGGGNRGLSPDQPHAQFLQTVLQALGQQAEATVRRACKPEPICVRKR
jgi:hypothetical protein